MQTIGEVSKLLADCAERVAAYLLPAGKKIGRQWCAGNTSGEAGESLKVTVHGPHSGQWTDYATSEHGDLIDLWRAVRGGSLNDALKDCKAFLGLRDIPMETTAKKSYRRPGRQKDWKPLTNPAIEWLTNVRKLSLHTIAEYKLEYVKHPQMGDSVLLPYLCDGKLVTAKYRQFPGKDFRQEAGCEPALFGWHCFPDGARQVVITEGEFDTMALHTYGINALSVDKGGGGGEKQGWVTTEFDRLARFDRILLALDNDQAGKDGVAEIIRRLGQERCFVVTIPGGHKDFNDCLMAGVPVEEILQSLSVAKSCDPPELRRAGKFTEEVVSVLTAKTERGIRLPWKKVGDRLILRPGEVTILAGRNGHGKSQCVGWILLDAMLMSMAICCVASLEFRTSRWLARLVKQACAATSPAEGFIRAAMAALDEMLWSFDQTSGVDYKRMIEVFRYAARRYKCELFVIDNLAKCGIPEDDYRGQHKFIQDITNFARDEDVHVIVVHHMKKGHNETDEGGKMDVKGSGVVTDLPDTTLTIWRNKAKEKAAKLAEAQGKPIEEKYRDQPDSVVECHKQRNGDHEPRIALWFDQKSYQFLESPHQKPRPMIEWSAMNHSNP